MCHFFIRFEFHFVMGGDILLLLRYLSFVVTFEIANYLLRILAYKFILPRRLSYAIFLKNSPFPSLLLLKPKRKMFVSTEYRNSKSYSCLTVVYHDATLVSNINNFKRLHDLKYTYARIPVRTDLWIYILFAAVRDIKVPKLTYIAKKLSTCVK